MLKLNSCIEVKAEVEKLNNCHRVFIGVLLQPRRLLKNTLKFPRDKDQILGNRNAFLHDNSKDSIALFIEFVLNKFFLGAFNYKFTL